MSYNTETKREVLEAVQKMYEALDSIRSTPAMNNDAMEAVDLAALAIYDAYDMTFICCHACNADELVELATDIGDGNHLCESCSERTPSQ